MSFIRVISLTESLSLTTRSAHSTRLNAGGYNTPTQLPLILYTLHATRQLPMSLSSTTSRHRCLTGVFTAAAAIEAFADEPLGSIAPASEVRDYKSDRIALCIKILILGRHRVSPTPLLHPRRPWKSCTTTWTNAFFYKKLFEDLSACNNWNEKRKVRILPRLRDEIQTLLTCPVAFHTEAIEGILMQRFFGSSRSSIRRRYKRRADNIEALSLSIFAAQIR